MTQKLPEKLPKNEQEFISAFEKELQNKSAYFPIISQPCIKEIQKILQVFRKNLDNYSKLSSIPGWTRFYAIKPNCIYLRWEKGNEKIKCAWYFKRKNHVFQLMHKFDDDTCVSKSTDINKLINFNIDEKLNERKKNLEKLGLNCEIGQCGLHDASGIGEDVGRAALRTAYEIVTGYKNMAKPTRLFITKDGFLPIESSIENNMWHNDFGESLGWFNHKLDEKQFPFPIAKKDKIAIVGISPSMELIKIGTNPETEPIFIIDKGYGHVLSAFRPETKELLALHDNKIMGKIFFTNIKEIERCIQT